MKLRVAVITPYFGTSDEWLKRCHESVRAQDYPCTHILIADGEPKEIVKEFTAQHIVLPVCHDDVGDTPRAIGSLSAIGQGFDAIAYLDADNWYRPDHISSLLALHERTGAAILTSMRSIHHLDGTLLAICLDSDGERFCDTSCLMLMRPAFELASVWAHIAPGEHVFGDRIMWFHIGKSGLPRANNGRPTVAYTARHAAFYGLLNWPIPPGVRNNNDITEAHARWIARGNPPLESMLGHYRLTAAAFNYRGLALRSAGRHEEALASFDDAIAVKPDHAEAHNNRGLALQALGRAEEALASYDKALAIEQDYAVCYNNRGVVLGALKRHGEALASFERAYLLRPDYEIARNNRDAALRLLGSYENVAATSVAVVSFYMANIPLSVVLAQGKVLRKFVPPRYTTFQILTTKSHGDALDDFFQGTNFEIVVFIDIDCIPLHAQAIDKLIESAKNMRLAGCAQRANHIENGGHVYAGPFCIALSRRLWDAIGKPSFRRTATGDVGEMLTLACERHGYSVDLILPSKVDVKRWHLKDDLFFGYRTQYGDDFWHAFEIRHPENHGAFINYCVELLERD